MHLIAARRRRVLAACAALLAAACGGNTTSEPTRSYELPLRVDDSTDEYMYIAEDVIDLRAGDEVTFVMRNTGTLDHDLRVLDEDGRTVAAADAVQPGDELDLTVFFEEPGFYRLHCSVDDHLTVHGMQAIVQVADV
ncbi:MAG: hypothetical protein QNJ12_09825 [Ilumatobacter sp.]|uniref:hypothetical protein n=1 Tax=Ilumatobacter sp. TaxID=1967498 RepID=UPI00261CDC2E|nr:hypothetical protein [Ilumatobacter sp.]MDJ0769083.1 hypothetical protein [Ilumatobacter sp.]